MVSRELLLDLLHHMEWADARVWDAVSCLDTADTRLHELLTHIHTVQYAFLFVWRSTDVAAVFEQSQSLATDTEVRAWARAYYEQAEAYIGSAGDSRLAQPIQMPWADQLTQYLGHPPHQTTVAETALQVASHSTYHRGQVNARLRELGATPPLVDYIAWLWSGRPRPRWPE